MGTRPRTPGDYGYYYPDFEAIAAGETLVAAQAGHDARLDEYAASVGTLVASLAPTARHNVELHERLLLS